MKSDVQIIPNVVEIGGHDSLSPHFPIVRGGSRCALIETRQQLDTGVLLKKTEWNYYD